MTAVLDPLALGPSRSDRTGSGSQSAGGLLDGSPLRVGPLAETTYVPGHPPLRDLTLAVAGILASLGATIAAVRPTSRAFPGSGAGPNARTGASLRAAAATSADGAVDADAYLALASQALGDGHLELGRSVIRAGLLQHPGAPALRAASAVLAPPRVIDAPPAKRSARVSLAWVDSIAPNYRGEWIVVEGTEVRAHAKRLADLTEIIARLGDSALTVRIPEEG